jgi:hypothetical protein
MEQPVPPYEWIRWLSGTDATALLMVLCAAIEKVNVSHETLRTMIQDWRTNASGALGAENWQTSVYASLDITVDARLYLLSQNRLWRGS